MRDAARRSTTAGTYGAVGQGERCGRGMPRVHDRSSRGRGSIHPHADRWRAAGYRSVEADALPRRRALRRRDQRSTAERGYGHAHRKERDRWKPLVNSGGAICWRCRQQIPPAGRGRCPKCGKWHRTWHLGHDDHDRSVYRGPEHLCCNEATAGRRKRITKHAQTILKRTSREW